jgi:hypothetical protein
MVNFFGIGQLTSLQFLQCHFVVFVVVAVNAVVNVGFAFTWTN